MPENPSSARPAPEQFRAAVSQQLTGLLQTHRARAEAIHPEAAAVIDAVIRLTSGGKRLRALLGWLGWRAAGGAADDPRIVTAGAAFELFQAAALIHDDILDRSDTRRGMPAVHRAFEALHRSSGWRQDAGHFGTSAAILAGDVCLSLSDAAFHEAFDGCPRPRRTRQEMETMRLEVMLGQYLDVLAEVAPPAEDPSLAARRAATVVEFKSARYTAVHPAALGVLLAGGDDALVSAFEPVTLPFGLAFQYQDDLLGVFGDPAVTGKPAGDDLREGKRTVLIAHALDLLPAAEAAALEEDLGRPDLDGPRVESWQQRLRDCGAHDRVRDEVDALVSQAQDALEGLERSGAEPTAVVDLRALMQGLLDRTA